MGYYRKSNIIMTMFWYWIIIIVWQYVRPVANRSLIDTAVKMGMFAVILLYAMRNGRGIRLYGNTGSCILLFFITQIFTVAFDSGDVSTGNIITIVFMFIEIMVFLVMLDHEVITEEELTKFCRYLLFIALVMCIYNMTYHSGRFLATFTSGSAYGRECKSFLYSNHEFGIYLAAAIISSSWLTIRRKLKKVMFLLSAGVLGVNLLSTYSRTAILGCIAALFILVFFYSKRLFGVISVCSAGILLYITSTPSLNNIIFNKIMKGSFQNGQVLDAGRSSMYEEEMQNFLDGSFFQKLFGYGYGGKSEFGGHDAYLTILLIGGVFMFIFFIAVILMGTNYALKTMRVNKSIGSLMIGYIVFTVLYMVAQTPILFFSSMDSFFITMLAVIIPKYIYNYYYRFYGTEIGYSE